MPASLALQILSFSSVLFGWLLSILFLLGGFLLGVLGSLVCVLVELLLLLGSRRFCSRIKLVGIKVLLSLQSHLRLRDLQIPLLTANFLGLQLLLPLFVFLGLVQDIQ